MAFANPLSYPAHQSPDNGIDERLGKAHQHSNLQLLDLVTQELLDKIEDSIPSDFERWDAATVAALEDAVVEDKDLVVDVTKTQQGKLFVRNDNGGWTEFTSENIPLPITVDSNSSKFTGMYDSQENKLTLEVDSQLLEDIEHLGAKMNRYTGNQPFVDYLPKFDANGDLEPAIASDTLVVQDDIVNAMGEVLGDTTRKAASAASLKALKQEMDDALAGIGKPRGSVYNALVSTTRTNIVSAIALTNASKQITGFTVGDIFGIYLTPIDATFIVTAVDSSGKIEAIRVLSAGASLLPYNNVTFSLYPVATHNSVATELQAYISTDNTTASTLASITNPAIGDSAYVVNDEQHGGVKTIWMYKELNQYSKGWSYVMPVDAEVPIFYQQ